MNDPHVVALIYKIVHGSSVCYDNAEPAEYEEKEFSVKVADGEVRFEMKKHYATKKKAQEACDEYIRAWEMNAGLEMGPDAFRLKFEKPEIIDRKPTPGVRDLRINISGGEATIKAHLTVLRSHYPSPPSEMKITPDVQSMYDRFMGYRSGKEPLASMAYFCLTVLEESVRTHKKGTQRVSRTRKDAAECYGIPLCDLKKIGELSSERGGADARKAGGRDTEFTSKETRFLKKMVKKMIRRAAKMTCDP